MNFPPIYFSLPLPHPRQNEKKYLFQDRVPDYTRAMREIAPKPMSSSFSFLPFFSSRMKWAETFAPRLIRARFLQNPKERKGEREREETKNNNNKKSRWTVNNIARSQEMKNFARGWPSTSAYPSRDPSLCSESEFRSSIVLPMLNCTREGERKKISGVGVFPILAFCADRVKEKSVFFFFFCRKISPTKANFGIVSVWKHVCFQ